MSKRHKTYWTIQRYFIVYYSFYSPILYCCWISHLNWIMLIEWQNTFAFSFFLPVGLCIVALIQVLVCQLEVPMEATLAALRRFKHGISILNASPAPRETTLELFTLPTILCINQIEAAAMSKRAVPNIEWVLRFYWCIRFIAMGFKPSSNSNFPFSITHHYREAKRAISNFLCLGSNIVIITLGKEGAVFASAAEPRPVHVRPPKVEEVLDTTVRLDIFTRPKKKHPTII